MSRKIALIGFLFFLGSYSVFAQYVDTLNAQFEGALEQKLDNEGAALQTQVFRLILNASTNKRKSELMYTENYKEMIDSGYSYLINSIIKMYTDTELGDCYWYKYDPLKNTLGTKLRKPYNVMLIIVYVSASDIGSGRLSNVDIHMTHVNADGYRYRMTNAEITHMDTSRMNNFLLVLNDNLKRSASFLPSDGSGSPEFNVDRFVQENDEKVMSNYNPVGVLPDTTNGIKR